MENNKIIETTTTTTTTTKKNMLTESDKSGLNFKETELTLGLPGDSRSVKREFSRTVKAADNDDDGSESEEVTSAGKAPVAKAQVIGWPPVRQSRKQIMVLKKRCTYVKVAVDGAPYLRKVDLEMYASYQQLLSALEKMFTCFTIRMFFFFTELAFFEYLFYDY
ncbi:hypothetical protein AQUCO_00100626v1 [Aquilegia coerulea]|uniref:Auxin-responsive protein n=1 Tax=Aquilegia coerulea TaxID=218851 RepID=A0A2G5FB78_AQUCA|nr:hypothetical protein AQUCO_00100626v1 [Aquilegia coerulea]